MGQGFPGQSSARSDGSQYQQKVGRVACLKRPETSWEWQAPTPAEEVSWPPSDSEVLPLHGAYLFKSLKLDPVQRQILLQQATLMLEQVYAHREHKRTVYGVDPIARLKAFIRRLQESVSESRHEEVVSLEGELVPRQDLLDLGFHRDLTRIFNSLRDLHTVYMRPKPLQDLVAFLPFDVERAYQPEAGDTFRACYVVTHVRRPILKAGNALEVGEVKPGWEVEQWNGRPIEFAIARNAAEHPGSNESARFALGLEQLTQRPLATSPIPDELRVRVRFRKPNDERVHREFRWLVTGVSRVRSLSKDRHGLNIGGEKAGVYNYQAWLERQEKTSRSTIEVSKSFRRHLSARRVSVELDGVQRAVGLLRIYSFHRVKPRAFRTEIKRLLTHPKMPGDGLILDLRGNPGGEIPAAEAILQLFTPRKIEPEPFQFVFSPLTQKLTAHADATVAKLPDLSSWSAAEDAGVATRTIYSRAHAMTTPTSANIVGQVYHGPCVLIADAGSYSAADIFIAGFQDHGIGPVIGIDPHTGAGGANDWTYSFLREVLWGTRAVPTFRELPDPDVVPRAEDFPPLPEGTELRVAIRRSLRVGRKAGVPLEDLGVVSDYLYRPTVDDLLKGNRDLFEHAAELLRPVPAGQWPAAEAEILKQRPRLCRLSERCGWLEPAKRRLELRSLEVRPKKVKCTVTTEGVERLEVSVAGRPEKFLPSDGGRIDPDKRTSRTFTVRVPRARNVEVKVEGYTRDENKEWRLVASLRKRKLEMRHEIKMERIRRRRREREKRRRAAAAAPNAQAT